MQLFLFSLPYFSHYKHFLNSNHMHFLSTSFVSFEVSPRLITSHGGCAVPRVRLGARARLGLGRLEPGDGAA